MNIFSFLKTDNRIARLEHFVSSFVLSFLIGLTILVGSYFIPFANNFILFILLIVAAFLVVFLGLKIILIHISRLHDMNLSGWWLLLTCVPLIGNIWFILIYVIPGTAGSNRFGEQPVIPTTTLTSPPP